MMVVLRRLSACPTIPEMMAVETDARMHRVTMSLCLAAAASMLRVVGLLLRLRLVEPWFAAGAWRQVQALAAHGMVSWRRYRRTLEPDLPEPDLPGR